MSASFDVERQKSSPGALNGTNQIAIQRISFELAVAPTGGRKGCASSGELKATLDSVGPRG
jgi:hypothetical protein